LDVNRTHAESVAAEITRAGGTASAYECDVSDRVSIGSTFHKILQERRVHILAKNAVEVILCRAFDRTNVGDASIIYNLMSKAISTVSMA
jgi:NAD(P)-dependent dehydrogenase (short-subunit alcohol dehydrogenase family)